MQMKTFRVGPLSTNSYLLWDEDGEALLIDAAGGSGEILEFITAKKLKLNLIVATHGHYDHIAANTEFIAASKAKLLIHQADEAYPRDIDLNLAGFFSPKYTPHQADRLLVDGDLITCGDLTLQVIHTPGHTPGGICLLGEGVLFTGDTLFAGGIGRSDLVGGDGDLLLRSIRERLLPLAEELPIYPGHGDSSTLGREKKTNPWL